MTDDADKEPDYSAPDYSALYGDAFDDAPESDGEWQGGGFQETHRPKEKSKTALKVDLWGMRKGREMAQDKELNLFGHDEITMADFHAAAFEPYLELAELPEDKVRSQWMKNLLESDEFRRMKPNTTLDLSLSEVAGFTLANRYYEFVQGLSEEEKQQLEGSGNGDGDSEESEGEDGPSSIGLSVKMMRSTSEALEKANEEVDNAKSAAAGLGLGDKGGRVDPKKAMQVFKKMKKNADLHRICSKMGRFLRLAQSMQRQKKVHGLDDVVGVELSGDIRRILPQELALLGDEVLELEAMRKIAERQAMSRSYQAFENVARGPIVVCVDESGSMHGEPHEHAKAFAATLGWIAKSQGRWCAFVGFSGGCEGTRVAFPPGEWDTEKMIDWLTHFYGGGTTLDVPLHELPNVYWPEFGCPKGQTDVVIITDAYVNAPKDMVDSFNQWKEEEQVRTYGIILNSSPGDLSLVCDQTWIVDQINVEQECVGNLFSL